jgi:hypothetical protein
MCPTDAEWALPLFMVAASCENCAASVIYPLLRRNVNALEEIMIMATATDYLFN